MGAVESLGKELQRRLGGCGNFWSRSGLTSLLHLSVLLKKQGRSAPFELIPTANLGMHEIIYPFE